MKLCASKPNSVTHNLSSIKKTLLPYTLISTLVSLFTQCGVADMPSSQSRLRCTSGGELKITSLFKCKQVKVVCDQFESSL